MSEHVRPQIFKEGDVTVVTFGSALKTINEDYISDVSEVMQQAADQEPPLVVLDLDGVEFFGSSFIELVFRVWNRLNKRQGRFALCCLFPYCKEVLQVTNLNTVWKILETRAEAVAWVQSDAE